jgi:hypothetical protein
MQQELIDLIEFYAGYERLECDGLTVFYIQSYANKVLNILHTLEKFITH